MVDEVSTRPAESNPADTAASAPESGPTAAVLTAIGARRPQDDEEADRPLPRLAILAAAAAIAAVWALLSLWGLGDAPFHTKGEPREALVVWEMNHGSSWILPYRNGTELPSKPPLFHWLGAITAEARGTLDEWSVRFPSAITSLLGAWLVLLAGSILWSVGAGLCAGLALLSSFEWARAATTGRVDMVLTFGLELAFVSFLLFLRHRSPRWLLPLYLGIALSILGKGPVGAVLPGLLVIVVCLLSRDVTPLQQMRVLRGLLLVVVLGGSWYVLAYFQGGYDFFYKQVLDENVFRFLGSKQLSGGHRHPAWRLYLLLLVGLLPWTLLLPAVVSRIRRERAELSAQGGVGYLLLWFLVVLGFYSIPASKRSVYLLALYPAAALLVGWWVAAARDDKHPSPWLRRILVLAGPAAAGFGLILLALTAAFVAGLPLESLLSGLLKEPDALALDAVAGLVRERAVVSSISAAVLAVAGVTLAVKRHQARPLSAFLCLFAIAAAANVFTRQAVLPAIAETRTPRDLMHAARSVVPADQAIFFYETFDYGAVYYSDGHIPVYRGTWPVGGPQYLLVKRRFWERARANAIHHYDVARDETGEPLQSASLVLLSRQGKD